MYVHIQPPIYSPHFTIICKYVHVCTHVRVCSFNIHKKLAIFPHILSVPFNSHFQLTIRSSFLSSRQLASTSGEEDLSLLLKTTAA